MEPSLTYKEKIIALSDTQELFDILDNDDELNGQDYAALYPADKYPAFQKLNDVLMGNSGKQGVFRLGYVDEESSIRLYGGLDKVYGFIPLGLGEIYFDYPLNPEELEIRQEFNYGDFMVIKDVPATTSIHIESPAAPIYYLMWYLEDRDSSGQLRTTIGIFSDILNGYTNVADYMISNGMDPNRLLDRVGPYFYNVDKLSKLVDYLLSEGGNKSRLVQYINRAYEEREEDTLEYLLSKVDADIVLGYISRASEQGDLEMVKFIMSLERAPNSLSLPINLARLKGYTRVVKYLQSLQA